MQALAVAGLSTVIASLAVLGLAQAGFGPEGSLVGGLILAGSLNIAAHAALNRDEASPTSPVPIGDI